MSKQTSRKMPVNQTKQNASTSGPNTERRTSNTAPRRYSGDKRTQNATPNINSNRNGNGRNTRKNVSTSNNKTRNPEKLNGALASNSGTTNETSASNRKVSSTNPPKGSSHFSKKNSDIKTAVTSHPSSSKSETISTSGNDNTDRIHRSNSEPTNQTLNKDKPTTNGSHLLNEDSKTSRPISTAVSEQPSDNGSNCVRRQKDGNNNLNVESKSSDQTFTNTTAPMKVFPSFRGEYPTRNRQPLVCQHWPQRAGGKPNIILQENESEFEQRAERGCTTVTETHFLSIDCPTASAVAHNPTAMRDAAPVDGDRQAQAVCTSNPIAATTNAYEDVITYSSQPPTQTYRDLQQEQTMQSSALPQQYNSYWQPTGTAFNIPFGGTWPNVNVPTIQSYVGAWSQAGHPPQQPANYPIYQQTAQQQQLYSNAYQQMPKLHSEIPGAAGVTVSQPFTATNPMYRQVLLLSENAAMPDERTNNQQYQHIRPDVTAASAQPQIQEISSAQPRANTDASQPNVRWEQNQVPRLLEAPQQQQQKPVVQNPQTAPICQCHEVVENQQQQQQINVPHINHSAAPCDAQSMALRITEQAQQQVTQVQQHIAQMQQSLNNNNTCCCSTQPIQDVSVAQAEIQQPQQEEIVLAEPMQQQQQTVEQQTSAVPLQQQQQSQQPQQYQAPVISCNEQTQQQSHTVQQQQSVAVPLQQQHQTQQQSNTVQQMTAAAPFQQPQHQNQQPVTSTVSANIQQQQQQQTFLPPIQYDQLNPLQMIQNGNNIYDLNNQNSIMFQPIPLMIPSMNQYHMLQTLPQQSSSQPQCLYPIFAPVQGTSIHGASTFNGMQQRQQYGENGGYGPQTAPLQAQLSFGYSQQYQPNNHQCYSPRCRQRHGRYGNIMPRWR